MVVRELELAEKCLRLLQLGAADCLPRPLDLPRLAYLAELLTLAPVVECALAFVTLRYTDIK
jgi:hypothetical protein